MTALELRAFVSYTNRGKRDYAIALKVEEGFSRAGFVVWAMHQTRSLGERWFVTYQREVKHACLLLAIVSKEYVGQPHCRHEVMLADKQCVDRGMKVVPFFVEEVKPEDLADEKAREALDLLGEYRGSMTFGEPIEADIAAMAQQLRLELENAPGSRQPPSSETKEEAKGGESGTTTWKPDTPRPVMSHPDLYTVRVFDGEVRVSFTSDCRALKLRRVLISRLELLPDGTGVWRLSKEQYEGIFQNAVDEVLSDSAVAQGG